MNENVSAKERDMPNSLESDSNEQMPRDHIQRLFDSGQHDAEVFTDALGEAETDQSFATEYLSYTPSTTTTFFSLSRGRGNSNNDGDDVDFEGVPSVLMGSAFMDIHGTGSTNPSNQDIDIAPLRFLNFGYSESLSQLNSVQSTEGHLSAIECSINSAVNMSASRHQNYQISSDHGMVLNDTEQVVRNAQPPLCAACLVEGRFERECSLCVKCHIAGHTTAECMGSVPEFSRFMDLASEIRERIYSYALDIGRPIKPYMCDSSQRTDIKFHDDNQSEHNGMNAFMGLLRVSKKVRAEALPIFYSTNTFFVGCDTTTYLDHLKHLDRFHMIRRVWFDIPMYRESSAPSILRRMSQFIKEVDEYEKVSQENQTVESLKQHPQYKQGGLLEINLLTVLKKLSSPIAASTAAAAAHVASGSSIPRPTLEIILSVPNAQNFAACDRLKWLQTVLYGIGIAVRFADGKPFACTPDNLSVSVIWQQRYQKKDFDNLPEYVCPLDAEGQTAAYRRALELNAKLESERRERGWAFMRVGCKNRDVVWFDVDTEGGGIGW